MSFCVSLRKFMSICLPVNQLSISQPIRRDMRNKKDKAIICLVFRSIPCLAMPGLTAPCLTPPCLAMPYQTVQVYCTTNRRESQMVMAVNQAAVTDDGAEG